MVVIPKLYIDYSKQQSKANLLKGKDAKSTDLRLCKWKRVIPFTN